MICQPETNCHRGLLHQPRHLLKLPSNFHESDVFEWTLCPIQRTVPIAQECVLKAIPQRETNMYQLLPSINYQVIQPSSGRLKNLMSLFTYSCFLDQIIFLFPLVERLLLWLALVVCCLTLSYLVSNPDIRLVIGLSGL